MVRRNRAKGAFLVGRKNRKRIAELLVGKFGTVEAVNGAIASRKTSLLPMAESLSRRGNDVSSKCRQIDKRGCP